MGLFNSTDQFWFVACDNALLILFFHHPCSNIVVISATQLTNINPTSQHDALFTRKACCGGQFRSKHCFPQSNRTFENFLQLVVVDDCHTEHWGPLTHRIEPKFWKKMNFIGHLENVQEDAKKLLQRIGAWEEHGKTGWGPNKTWPIFASGPSDDEAGIVNHNLARKEGRGHSTDSHDKVALFYGDRPDLVEMVTEYYRDDYGFDLLGYKPPVFDYDNKHIASSTVNYRTSPSRHLCWQHHQHHLLWNDAFFVREEMIMYSIVSLPHLWYFWQSVCHSQSAGFITLLNTTLWWKRVYNSKEAALATSFRNL